MKALCFCTGELMEHYGRVLREIEEKLARIRDEYLAETGGICRRYSRERVIRLPKNQREILHYKIDAPERMDKFHDQCRYKSEEAKTQARDCFTEILGLVDTAKTLGDNSRLLLDRGVMRSLFRRPKGDEFKLLNTTAHPTEKILKDPRYALTLLWLTRWPGPNTAKPDPGLKRLGEYDQSLLFYYARPLNSLWTHFHGLAYLEVSSLLALLTRPYDV